MPIGYVYLYILYILIRMLNESYYAKKCDDILQNETDDESSVNNSDKNIQKILQVMHDESFRCQ